MLSRTSRHVACFYRARDLADLKHKKNKTKNRKTKHKEEEEQQTKQKLWLTTEYTGKLGVEVSLKIIIEALIRKGFPVPDGVANLRLRHLASVAETDE